MATARASRSSAGGEPSRQPARSERSQGEKSDERLLAAALACFSERGFDGTTTREIAARAGVNLGLIQYHFGDKEALWRAAVDRAFEDLRAGLEGLMNDASREGDLVVDEARMRRLIRAYVHFVARHPEFIRLMHDEGRRPGPRMRWIVDRHVRPLFEGVLAFVRSAQSSGVLPAEIEPLHFHYILAGAVGLFFHQAAECRRLTGHDPTEEAMVEAHADAVEALLVGPGPRRTG